MDNGDRMGTTCGLHAYYSPTIDIRRLLGSRIARSGPPESSQAPDLTHVPSVFEDEGPMARFSWDVPDVDDVEGMRAEVERLRAHPIPTPPVATCMDCIRLTALQDIIAQRERRED